jgi:hypothetical protein
MLLYVFLTSIRVGDGWGKIIIQNVKVEAG